MDSSLTTISALQSGPTTRAGAAEVVPPMSCVMSSPDLRALVEPRGRCSRPRGRRECADRRREEREERAHRAGGPTCTAVFCSRSAFMDGRLVLPGWRPLMPSRWAFRTLRQAGGLASEAEESDVSFWATGSALLDVSLLVARTGALEGARARRPIIGTRCLPAAQHRRSFESSRCPREGLEGHEHARGRPRGSARMIALASTPEATGFHRGHMTWVTVSN